MDKRQILEFMQCALRFRWSADDRDAAELKPDLVALDLFAEGQQVGRAARGFLPGREYEREFSAGGVTVRVDALERGPAGVRIVEVKATRRVDAGHLDDLAVQVHVLRAAGETVVGADLVHLNPEWRAPGPQPLFSRVDCTAKVERRLGIVAEAIAGALAASRGPLPVVPIGAYCERGKPEECPFAERCWKDVPSHHVSSLYYIGKRWPEFVAQGYHRIADLPDEIPLPRPETRRQLRAIKEGRRIVEPGLAERLGAWRRPLAFLDFETVSCAIPTLAGATSWEQVPVQWSLHHEDGRHFAWIVDREEDPREPLAHALVEACRGAGTVVAYSADFERGCLRHLQMAVPALAGPLKEIEERVEDAAPPVRAHVYDQAFGGGFSLKKVQPALLPELLGYAELAVREGRLASVLLKHFMAGDPGEPAERAALRADLLAYCEQDTLGLMRLVERLRELGAAAG